MRLFGQARAAFLLFSFILIVDQITKWLTEHYIPLMIDSPMVYPYGGIGIFRNFLGIEFSITFLTNYGAAWGVLADFHIYLLCLRIILIFCLLAYLLFFNTQPRWVLPIALVMAGAIGNVIDFFTYGYVIDMVHFIFWGYDYPVFNLADSAVFIGVAWIALTALLPAPAVATSNTK